MSATDEQALPVPAALPGGVRSIHGRIKRMLDPVLAAVILVLLAPLFVTLMIGIRSSSKGPVFFRQARYGEGKKLFDIWKFRSMYIDRCDDRVGAAINQATKGDPRVTPLGRFMRRTSLDEMPQLINVLNGEMSLVGPRPHAIAEDDHFARLIDRYDDRFRVKPGITGLAQVSGLRGEITSVRFMERRVAADNAYIERLSLWLDAWILARTVIVLFKKEGAY